MFVSPPFPRYVYWLLAIQMSIKYLTVFENPCDSQGARPTHAETSVTSVEEHMRGTALGWRLWRHLVRSVLGCTLRCSLPPALFCW